MALTQDQAQSIAAICLHAALADGGTSADERQRLERVFTLVGQEAQSDIYQRVVLGGSDLATEAAGLKDATARTLAYDMAVAVCDADGSTTAAERIFLDKLRDLLAVDAAHAAEAVQQGEQIALALQTPAAGDVAVVPVPVPAPVAAPAKPAIEQEIDGMVLRYAILNGAIELLPQDLATMAILPLQMKMVYRIGKCYGHELSAGHIKEFLGVAGVGMTSQVLEGYARKLLGKLAGKTMGKTAGKLAAKATGPAMTFATTYALGQVARQYYAGGRKLGAIDVQGLFQRSVQQGQQVYQQYAPQVSQQSSSLNMGRIMDLVRGKAAV